MDDKILEIMKRVFNTQSVSVHSNNSNCDEWDSLHQLILITELEEEFDTEFEPEEISEMKSFDAVKSCLEKKLAN